METISGHDVYLRYDNGPVQCLRAWDAQRFLTSQVEQGLANKNKSGELEPIMVSTATREEYLAEHKRK